MKEIQAMQVPCFRRWSRKNFAIFASLSRCVKIGVLSATMSIVLLAAESAKAQTADTLDVWKTIHVEEVTVSGSKSSPTRSVIPQTVIYDRKAEGDAPVQTIESALKTSPSVDLRERGGKGVQADISLRGGSFDQTMVMLNGINFTDARTGHQSHSLPVDIDCVSGIDMIDGVAGIGAYAGAINIRTMPLKPRYLRVEATGGQYGYAYGNLSGAYYKDGFSIFGATSYRRSDGYTANTGFSNCNAYLRMNYDTRKIGYFDLQTGYQTRRFGANGFYSLKYPDQWEQTSTAIASLRWFKSFGRFTVNASGSYRKNFDRYELIKGQAEVVPFNYHNTDNIGAEMWGDYDWIGGVTSLGGDYVYNHIWSTVLGEETDTPNGRYDHEKGRNTSNIWLRHVKRFFRFDIAGSIGMSFTPYGRSVLWSLSGGYIPTEGLRLSAGAAQSMRLPTFTDLYYTTVNYVGNPYLVPETAVTYRFAADYAKGRWNAGLLVYYRDGRNTIDWVRPTPESDWQSMQITQLGTCGLELSGGYSAEGFLRRISASYGYISQDKSSEGYVSKYALDYMKHKAAISAEFRFLRNFSLVLTGSVYDRNGNYTDANGIMQNYKTYLLLDGRLSWERGCCRLYIDTTNITCTQYYDFGGIRMPGAWFSGGVVITI